MGPDKVTRGRSRRSASMLYPVVHRCALAHTGDPMEADDLTQDVLVQMIRKMDSFRGAARLNTGSCQATRVFP